MQRSHHANAYFLWKWPASGKTKATLIGQWTNILVSLSCERDSFLLIYTIEVKVEADLDVKRSKPYEVDRREHNWRI